MKVFVLLFLFMRAVVTIRNGINARITTYPHVVFFVRIETSSDSDCHGTLIRRVQGDTSSDLVLTACHCIAAATATEYNYQNQFIVLGGKDAPSRQTRSILTAYCHPAFRASDSSSDDIAIVRLQSPVEFNEHIKGMLWEHNYDIPYNSECFVASYGPMAVNPDVFPKYLKEMKARVTADNRCQVADQPGFRVGFGICLDGWRWNQDRKQNDPTKYVHERAVTAPGDSGSGLMCKVRNKNSKDTAHPFVYVLAGVNKASPPRAILVKSALADADHVMTFTLVKAYKQWIADEAIPRVTAVNGK